MAASLKVVAVLALIICVTFMESSVVPTDARPLPARMVLEAAQESQGVAPSAVTVTESAADEDADEGFEFDQELVVLGH